MLLQAGGTRPATGTVRAAGAQVCGDGKGDGSGTTVLPLSPLSPSSPPSPRGTQPRQMSPPLQSRRPGCFVINNLSLSFVTVMVSDV